MTIAAVIPAYNEERTIAGVIKAVKEVKIIDKIIVVSDGSVDGTAKIASSLGAEVIELKRNVGKGGAMKAGTDRCDSDIIIFLDADLIGLNCCHIIDLLSPVVEGKAEMSVGIFKNGRLRTDMAQKIAPYLSGQRAIRRELFEKIPNTNTAKFGIELAMTQYMIQESLKVKVVELSDLTHFMKEEKLGFINGFIARLRMYWEILRVLTLLKG